MTVNTTSKAGGAVITRRAALLAPLAVSGCSWFDDWFAEKKTNLPGKREGVPQRVVKARQIADAIPRIDKGSLGVLVGNAEPLLPRVA